MKRVVVVSVDGLVSKRGIFCRTKRVGDSIESVVGTEEVFGLEGIQGVAKETIERSTSLGVPCTATVGSADSVGGFVGVDWDVPFPSHAAVPLHKSIKISAILTQISFLFPTFSFLPIPFQTAESVNQFIHQ